MGPISELVRSRARQEDGIVNLTIEPIRGTAKTKEVSLRYEEITTPVEEHRPSRMEEIEPGIYYLDVARVSEQEFESALPTTYNFTPPSVYGVRPVEFKTHHAT